MKQYLELMRQILDQGHEHEDRTKVGRISLFGPQLEFDLNEGFPLVTTRKIFTKGFIEEILWHIRGSSDVSELRNNGVKIWDSWAVEEGHIDRYVEKADLFDADLKAIKKRDLSVNYLNSIGPIYGAAWRGFYDSRNEDEFILNTHQDQLSNLLKNLVKKPYSSRHVITAWIPDIVPPDESLSPQENVLNGYGALAPCPVLQQYFVKPPLEKDGKKRISMKLYQRSADLPVGVPFNIAQYSLLLCMVAQVTDMVPDRFIISFGDVHLYTNQVDLAIEQLNRTPNALPKLVLNENIKSIFDFKHEDIRIDNYNYHEKIAFPVSV